MSTQERTEPTLVRLERSLRESLDAFWDRFVDADDALYDQDGTRWRDLGGNGKAADASAVVCSGEAELRDVRNQCRALAAGNEFAINGHENRISYVIGTGHNYRAAPREGQAASELAAAVQGVLEEFVTRNRWHQRQQEILRRKDRDGECFLRFFADPDGVLRLRFVEPEQVSTPAGQASNPAASFGILTDPQDVETVHGYYIDGQLVPADSIQHRKANVDANVKRGLPLYYPVRANLRRAEKLLRNMSVVAEIQSAIAIIRKHTAGTRASLEQFALAQADAGRGTSDTGRANHFRRYGPGTILDALGVDYEFPAAGIDASRFVAVLQAELRAIASRLVMPEFMLSSDASNSNYASTMAAEGPAVKMFQRLQYEMLEDDLAVMNRVVEAAVQAGRLPPHAGEAIEIRGIPPTLEIRDRLEDARADAILVQNGAMSVATMAMRHGLDPDRERRLSSQFVGQINSQPGGRENFKVAQNGA